MSVVWRIPVELVNTIITGGLRPGQEAAFCYRSASEEGLVLLWEGMPEDGNLPEQKSEEW